MKTYQVVVVFEVEANSLNDAEETTDAWLIDFHPDELPKGCTDVGTVKEDGEDNDGQRVYYFSPRDEDEDEDDSED